jgi:hypothetical protein
LTFVIGTPFSHNAGYHWDGQGKTKDENDVQTCPHCEAVILMQQWRKVEEGKMTGGFCMKCSKPVCGRCNAKMQTEGCIPFIAKLEKHFDMTVKLQQFIKEAGMEPATSRPIFTGLIGI